MKNRLFISFAFIIVGLFNLQYVVQDTCPNFTISDYQDEAQARLQNAENAITTMCNQINITADNYIILNDKDFYTDRSNPNESHIKWPYLINDDNIKYILLTPGDYRDYLTFYPKRASTGEKRFLVYYSGSEGDNISDIQAYIQSNCYGSTNTTVDQPEHERAIVEDFHLGNANGFNNTDWVIMGITFRGNHTSFYNSGNAPCGLQTGGSGNDVYTDDNIIKNCLFENSAKGNFIALANGDDNIIVDNVIRDRHDCSGRDIMGISLSANLGTSAEDNVILNNEIYNIGDAIHFIYQPNCRMVEGVLECDDTSDTQSKGTVPGTFIYNNRLYNKKIYTKDKTIYENPYGNERMHGEDAIDMKAGAGIFSENEADNLECEIGNKIIISSNKIYGWRMGRPEKRGNNIDECGITEAGSTGGVGNAFTLHGNANNIVIIDNDISDCGNGIQIAARGAFPPTDHVVDGNGQLHLLHMGVQHIEVYNNRICDLYPADRAEYEANPTFFDPHGVGFICNIATAKVRENKIKTAINGFRLEGEGFYADISDNYFENMFKQFLNSTQEYNGLTNNTFIDCDYVCGGSNYAVFNELITDSDHNNCFDDTDDAGPLTICD